jgi:DNA-binding response OmpR family regulator
MKRTILVVDDEESIRTLVRVTLEGPEFEVVEAHNGRKALELLPALRPDAVVMDWMMPGMSGVEALREMRRLPMFVTTPVVMLTAMGQEKDRHAAMDAGAQAYLMKPFSPLLLLSMLERLLEGAGKTMATAEAERNVTRNKIFVL